MRYCEKINFGQSRDTPSYAIFFNPEIFWKKRVPLRSFSVLWENQFSTKSWYTILCIFFNPEFSWNRRVLLAIFFLLWDKKTSRENRDIPILSIKIFDKRFFLKKVGFPYESFRYCEKIIFRQTRDTPSYAIFLFQIFSEKKVP